MVDPQYPSSGLVREVLLRKHPPPGAIDLAIILSDEVLPPNHQPHPVISDTINGDLFQTMAMRCQGAAGPSGINTIGWRHLCSSFERASSSLCHSLALVTHQLSSSHVDPNGLSTFVACRLIPLDKSPGVRHIGIGETCRQIASKAIFSVIGEDVLDAVGPLQLCAGQDNGCEAAVHSIHQLLLESDTEALLLVDVENAFNSFTWEIAQRNVLHLCPSLGRVLSNTYREPVALFVDHDMIYSLEGTTHGDPLAIAMYALGVSPLINHMSNINSTKQVWYADD